MCSRGCTGRKGDTGVDRGWSRPCRTPWKLLQSGNERAPAGITRSPRSPQGCPSAGLCPAPHSRSSEPQNPGQDAQSNLPPVRGGVGKEIHIWNSKISWFLSETEEWDQRFLQYQFRNFFSCHNESGIHLCSMTENQVLKAWGSYADTEFLKDWVFFLGGGKNMTS